MMIAFSVVVLRGWGDGPATASKPGYEVIVELSVTADGTVEGVKLVQADSVVLGQLGVGLAKRMKPNPKMVEGKPVKSVQRAPLFFPIAGDEGAEAMKGPLPKPVGRLSPHFPAKLLSANVAGGVIVSVDVDRAGRVVECRVVRTTNEEFAAAAVAAAQKWQFEPAQKDGRAVGSRLHVAFVFEPNGRRPDWAWYVPPRPAVMEPFIVRAEGPR